MSTPVDHLLSGVEWEVVQRHTHDHPAAGLWATHSGILEIMGHKLRCYRLSDGRAVFHVDDVHALFGCAAPSEENGG